MIRTLGMVFGCATAAVLLVLGLRFAPDVVVSTDEPVVTAVPALVEVDPVAPEVPAVAGLKVDVLRVERDGATLVSGRATPGAEIEIMVDARSAGTARVDTDGTFVAFVTLPESDAPQSLDLRERAADGNAREGVQRFVVESRRPASGVAARLVDVPAARLVDQAAVLVDEDADMAPAQTASPAPRDAATLAWAAPTDPRPEPRDTASSALASLGKPEGESVVISGLGEVPGTVSNGGGTAPTDRPDAPLFGNSTPKPLRGNVTPIMPAVQGVAPQGSTMPGTPEPQTLAARTSPPPATQEPTRPEAPRVLRVENGGLSVVQDSVPRPELSIDTIRYTPDGSMVLGGRAPGAASVRVYLDNRPLDAVQSAADGQWRFDMPSLEERTYTLRVDQLDAQGNVAARAETPFRPESPEDIDALGGLVEGGVRRVTVQPGFTLWAIAERNYGDGLSFVRVFEANADKIRNPDLIYPGQIFAVPD